MLQADSEDMFNKWVEALQHGIGAALQSGNSQNVMTGERKIHEDASNNNKKTKYARFLFHLCVHYATFLINILFFSF